MSSSTLAGAGTGAWVKLDNGVNTHTPCQGHSLTARLRKVTDSTREQLRKLSGEILPNFDINWASELLLPKIA